MKSINDLELPYIQSTIYVVTQKLQPLKKGRRKYTPKDYGIAYLCFTLFAVIVTKNFQYAILSFYSFKDHLPYCCTFWHMHL